MKTHHTPGPWEAHGPYVRLADGSNVTIAIPFAKTLEEPLISIEEQFANAQLIAASPDLLQTLIDLLSVAPSKAPAAGLIVGIEEKHAAAIRNAKAAIQKATGQAP